MGTIIDLTAPKQKENTDQSDFSSVHYDTEIIHLQNYDNFYSLMDRLSQRDASGQIGSSRLILVWPSRCQILESTVEFGRLRGWAARNQYEVGIVIPKDPVKMKMAKSMGFPVFTSIKEACESEWKKNSSYPKEGDSSERARRLVRLKKDMEQVQPIKVPIGLRFLAFLAAIAVLFTAFYFIMPQAKVEITPYLSSKTINMTIWADERLESPNLAGGIPVFEKRFDLSLSAAVPATGQVNAEPGIAVGSVVIQNTCDRIYYSPANAILSTSDDVESGINFITLDDLSLNPGEERNVRIEAAESGISGNLPAGSIQYPAYPNSLCWSIRQEQPTAGGTTGIYPAASDDDVIKAQQLIDDQIQKASNAALSMEPDSADLLPLGNASVVTVKKKQISPDPGIRTSTLNLRETIEVIIRTVRKSDMEAVIRAQSSRISVKPAILANYEILSGPTEENGLSTWSIRADYLVDDPETNEEALKIMLRGKPMDQAQSILGTLKHIKTYKIKLLPSFLKHFPFPAQNIHIIIHPAVETEKP